MSIHSIISRWLEKPQILSAEQQEQIAKTVEKYPYFYPAQYIHIGNRGLDKDTLSDLHVYANDWIQAHILLSQLKTDNPFSEAAQIDRKAGTEDAVQTLINVQEEDTNIKTETIQAAVQEETTVTAQEDMLEIEPVVSTDYFAQQGINVDATLPSKESLETPNHTTATENKDNASLMIMMSFTEWLVHFKKKSTKEKEEEADKKHLKSLWQKEKLAAALEDEDEEIPEAVFEMAVNSLTKEEGLVSESFAEILAKQGKIDKAIDMYKKLSLQNPQKSSYFAKKIEEIKSQNK